VVRPNEEWSARSRKTSKQIEMAKCDLDFVGYELVSGRIVDCVASGGGNVFIVDEEVCWRSAVVMLLIFGAI